MIGDCSNVEHETYYFIKECLYRQSNTEYNDVRGYIHHHFPSFVIDDGLTNNESLDLDKERDERKNTDDYKSFDVNPPDWFSVDEIEFEPYQMYINNTKSSVVYVKKNNNKIIFKEKLRSEKLEQIFKNNEVEYNDFILKAASSGIEIDKPIRYTNISIAVSYDDKFIYIRSKKYSKDEVYSYGVNTGISHWHYAKLNYQSGGEEDISLRGQDSYKTKYGLLIAEYDVDNKRKNDPFKFDNLSYLLKPILNNKLQLAFSYINDNGYNNPANGIGRTYFIKRNTFFGLELYNFSLFDYDYNARKSEGNLLVYSKDYSLATISSNGRKILSIQLSPGFNEVDDRLLSAGYSRLVIEKEYSNGEKETEIKEYFKKSISKNKVNTFFAKVMVGRNYYRDNYYDSLGFNGLYVSSLGNFHLNSFYIPNKGAASELVYSMNGIDIQSVISSKGDFALGSQFRFKILDDLYVYASAYKVELNDCKKESIFLNRKCGTNLSGSLTYSLPGALNATYTYTDYKSESLGVNYDSNRFSLSKSFNFNRFVISFNANYESKNYDSIYNSKMTSFNAGINFSYGYKSNSYSYSSSIHNSNKTNKQGSSNVLSFAKNDKDYNMNFRVSKYNQGEFSSSLYAGYNSPYGAFRLNTNYGVINNIGISHEYVAAINDKSYSLKSVNTLRSDAGLIFDMRNIPEGSDFRLNIKGSARSNVKISSSETSFYQIKPGNYKIMVEDDYLSDNGIFTVKVKDDSVDVFKGDIKTIQFSYEKTIVIGFKIKGYQKINIEGCTVSNVGDENYEATCLSDEFLTKGFIDINNDDLPLRCTFNNHNNYNNIYYSLGELTCD
ncbi:hypothetical protein H5201_21040 [Pseudoalteromonas sp. SG43-6]|uniref:hypothetical protein n=1 Tax=Pseudoalteromonas sp. SG43-6 TaxID=2760967 RepID=UPI0015FFF979|nr:hypothetical protein [Pseudoalteromonas sp. SG43-6]MBB1436741.1 hypothetical protein [Pseudoalteromonas sp. SG43-6]